MSVCWTFQVQVGSFYRIIHRVRESLVQHMDIARSGQCCVIASASGQCCARLPVKQLITGIRVGTASIKFMSPGETLYRRR